MPILKARKGQPLQFKAEHVKKQSSTIYLEDGCFEDRKDGHKVRLFVEGSYSNEDKDTEPCLMYRQFDYDKAEWQEEQEYYPDEEYPTVSAIYSSECNTRYFLR